MPFDFTFAWNSRGSLGFCENLRASLEVLVGQSREGKLFPSWGCPFFCWSVCEKGGYFNIPSEEETLVLIFCYERGECIFHFS